MNGLGRGQDVYVLRPSGDPLSARVTEASDRRYELAMAVAGAPAFAGAATLQFANGHGVYRVTGRVCDFDEAAGTLAFAVTGRPVSHQRRAFARIDQIVPLRYRDSDDNVHDGATINISGCGFLVSPPHALKMGEGLHFTLDLPHEEPLDCYAIPVRYSEGGAAGVHIESIDPADRERLVRFVFACERRALKMLRGAG